MPNILIVDDEVEIRKMLKIFFEAEDFNVIEADSGKGALRTAVAAKPDLVVLDLGLPDMDGQEVIRSVRQFSSVPIVVLTARNDEGQLVQALNAGADDYVNKPFRADVLLARVKANLRLYRQATPEPEEAINGPVRINLIRHEVYLDTQRVAFTPKEFQLLHVFVKNKGRMLTHKQILQEVWGPSHASDTQYLRVYIGQLRAKLETMPGLESAIVSENGIGYRMEMLTAEGSRASVRDALEVQQAGASTL